MTSQPFDEGALKVLFDEIEAPESLEANWRAKVALADTLRDPAAGEIADPVPEVPPEPEPGPGRRTGRRPGPPWLRALAAAVAATAVGGGIVGVVAVSRPPDRDPDPDQIIETVTAAPSPSTLPPTSFSATGTVPTGAPGSAPPGSGPGDTGPGPGGGAPGGAAPGGPAAPPAPPAPARGPLTEWPDAANTGLPAGSSLRTHPGGDLHVTQPGQIVADLRVNGTVYIEAPDVTLRRVMVAPLGAATAGIRQLPQAPRLRIEDSHVTNTNYRLDYGILQEAPGLVVQRSDINANTVAVLAAGDTSIVDSYLSKVQTRGNAARITLRHNTILVGVALLGQTGPVTDVAIDNNLLGERAAGAVISVPSGSGSNGIRVTANRFHRYHPAASPVPSSGWNPQAPGNIWTGNVWSDTGDPVNPS